MASAASAEPAQIAGPRRKKKSKLLPIILGVVVLVLLGGGAAAYFLLFAPKAGHDGEHMGDGEMASSPVIIVPEPEDPLPPGAFVDLRDITVNLLSPDRRNEFLRLGLTLELTPPGLPPGAQLDAWREGVVARTPKIIDILQPFLRELRAVDLRGSEGTYRLHENVLYRVRLVAPDLAIQDVHFRLLMVQ
jgi:flagellar protein FliL